MTPKRPSTVSNCLKSINEIEVWYNKIDTNRLNIRTISTYDTSANLIADYNAPTYLELIHEEFGKFDTVNYVYDRVNGATATPTEEPPVESLIRSNSKIIRV